MLPKKLQPYAKAIAPSVLTLIAIGGQWIASGAFSRTELATAVVGGLSALVTLLVPNREKKRARAVPARKRAVDRPS